MTSPTGRRIGALGALGMWLMVLMLLPMSARAQDEMEAGPGTDYRKCRAQAWADYNTCLMQNRTSVTNHYLCYYAWDLDNIGCDLALIKSLGWPF